MGRMTDEELQRLADTVLEVPGVRAVMLGGSRARGDHTPESDVDLGIYYERESWYGRRAQPAKVHRVLVD